MQKHLRLIALFALTLVTVVGGRAQTPTAAPAVAPQVAGEEEVTPIELEMQKVVDSVRTKIKAGVRTEAALAEEIKGFDAILAAHKGEHPEQLSLVLLMKGMLYVEVLKDFDKGEAVIRQLKAEFPNTPAGSRADSMLAAVAQQKESMKVQAALVPGAAFPNFEEKDLSGQPLSVAKYKGKVVLIDFWATWCPPCVAEVPNVIAAYQKYHDKGFEIIGISLDQNEGKLKGFMELKGMTWAQYFDGKGWGNKLARQFAISSVPTTFLLDRDGKIIARDLRGPALEAELKKQFGE